MKFELSGKMIVEADSLEDAALKIAEHFSLLGQGKAKNSPYPLPGTNIKLKKLGTKTPIPPPPKSPPPKRG